MGRRDPHHVQVYVTNSASQSPIGGGSNYQSNGRSRMRVSNRTSAASVATKIGLLTAFILLLAAVLNFTTQFKPYTWIFSAKTAGGTSGAGSRVGALGQLAGLSSTSPATKSPNVSGAALPAAAIAAESAVRQYFNLARQNNVDAMWQALTPRFQTQNHADFVKWWDQGVIDVEGPYFNYGTQRPHVMTDGTVWVQFAVRFAEDHTGARPHSRGWLNQLDVFWYRLQPIAGRYLIDDGQHASTCPYDLGTLADCESVLPLNG